MAQWGKHLFYKHEDMSSDPQHPHKAGQVAHIWNPSASMVRWWWGRETLQKFLGQASRHLAWLLQLLTRRDLPQAKWKAEAGTRGSPLARG